MISKTLLGAMATTFLAVVSSTMSSNALAVDEHRYNGIYCKPYYGNTMGNFNFYRSGIKNLTTTAQHIMCPIAMDETDAVTTTGTDVDIYWTAAYATDIITCTLYAQDAFATLDYLYATPGSYVTGYGTGSGVVNLTVSPDDAVGAYNLYCSLPGLASLNTIVVKEREDEIWIP